MRFFQLRDELAIPGRWHLGEIRLEAGSEPLLDAGLRLDSAQALRANVTHVGLVLHFSLTSFNVPVAIATVADAVASVANENVQRIPLKVSGQSGLFVLNSTCVFPCLDEEHSEFIKWTTKDHRADLAGQYRQITKLVLDGRSIPANSHFFRIKGSLVELIVSESVKDAMESAGCFGAKFIELPLSFRATQHDPAREDAP